MFDLASWIFQWQWNADNPQSTYWQPVLAKMLVTILCPPPTIERPQSINSFCGDSECYTVMNCIVLFLNPVLCSQSLQFDVEYNFTNMHPMSYRSEFLSCSCIVNIKEPAVYITLLLLSAVSPARLPIFLIPTTK